MDGRRRAWLAVDVHYYDSNLACGLRDRFGVAGVAVFDAFLRACKRSPIEGRVTYASVPDFLCIVGLPGLELRDETGAEWELDALWTYLGRMKNVSKTRSGRITNVRATRWERWQKARSGTRNAGGLSDGSVADGSPDSDKDSDNYKAFPSSIEDVCPQVVEGRCDGEAVGVNGGRPDLRSAFQAGRRGESREAS